MREATNQISSEPRRCGVGGSWCVEVLPRSPYQASYTPDLPIIGFAFEGQVGVHAFARSRKAAFQAKPNGLAHVPAGCAWTTAAPILSALATPASVAAAIGPRSGYFGE